MPSFKSIGTQLFEDLVDTDFTRATFEVATEIKEKAIQNASEGKAFGSDRFDRNYEPDYARTRKSRGYQVAFTDLQMGAKRIRRMNVKRESDKAVIEFDREPVRNGVTFGMVANFHHEGIVYKNGNFKMRSIFPKSIQSVPKEVHLEARKLAWEALRD